MCVFSVVYQFSTQQSKLSHFRPFQVIFSVHAKHKKNLLQVKKGKLKKMFLKIKLDCSVTTVYKIELRAVTSGIKCSGYPSAVCMTVSIVITPYCPDGIDGHRTLGDKPGLAGKRDMGQEEDFRTGLSVCQIKKVLHSKL